ncbi:hypothetical protein [Lysinibacillus xylanilyticus]|uniref:hypothetical protein n=1 Tax=Lysinibacillus xylanilyticus TaxID=582475 RepID=UPI003CFDB1FA
MSKFFINIVYGLLLKGLKLSRSEYFRQSEALLQLPPFLPLVKGVTKLVSLSIGVSITFPSSS